MNNEYAIYVVVGIIYFILFLIMVSVGSKIRKSGSSSNEAKASSIINTSWVGILLSSIWIALFGFQLITSK